MKCELRMNAYVPKAMQSMMNPLIWNHTEHKRTQNVTEQCAEQGRTALPAHQGLPSRIHVVAKAGTSHIHVQSKTNPRRCCSGVVRIHIPIERFNCSYESKG